MRTVLWCSCLLALAFPRGAEAQLIDTDFEYDAESEYEAYFGASRDSGEGASSIEEARRTGVGYRIGSSGSRSSKPSGDVHTVREGDTLWDLSSKYFGDPWHWPQLWSYNPEITNPHWIYPLDQLRLSAAAQQADADAAKAVMGSGQPAGPYTDGGSVVVPKQLLSEGTVFLQDMGYLDQEAYDTAGQITSGNEEQMFLSNNDQVYVKFKEGADVRAGQQYTVYRRMHSRERDASEKGELVRTFGTVVVRSYDRNTRVARGLISESLDPIERGYMVAKLNRRFNLVPPKRNEKTVVARIIASIRPRQLLGEGNVVFLDVGQGHGIQPGNRFFVVRRGDAFIEGLVRSPEEMGNVVPVPEYEKDSLPKEVVAELRVVKVRKETTIALVTQSDTDLVNGDVAEMRPGF